MAIPQFNINPYIQPYVGGVQKETGQLMNQRIQDYDLAAEGYDVLGYQTDTLLQNIAPFEADKLYGQELMGKYRKDIDAAAEKGDYEFMVRDVKRSARQFGAETAPLVARRKAFDDYRKTTQEQYQKGDIDLEMYNAALSKTVNDNSNVDKEAVMSGSFSGFIPTKKIDISKALDDAIKGMEANGKIGKMQVNSDGTYSIVGGEYRTKDDIEKAALAYLQGSSDYRNYATTLSTLGLTNKLLDETAQGLDYVKTKYKFDKPNAQQGFVPKDAWDRYAEMFKPPTIPDTAPGEVTENKVVQNLFENTKIKDGRLYTDDNYYTVDSDGGVTKYIGQDGKQITKEQYDRVKIFTNVFPYPGLGPTEEKVTGEELQKVSKVQNEQFNTLVENTLLSENGLDLSNLSTSQRNTVLNTSTVQEKINDPNYRKQVLDKYNAALKNHSKVETTKWVKQKPISVKAIGDMQVGNNSGALETSLAGRRISILSLDANDVGLETGFQKGKTDINTIQKQLEDKGWKIEEMKDNGLLTFNPTDPTSFGGSEVTFTLTKGTGESQKTRYISASVGLDLKDRVPILRSIQQVANAHLSGNGGVVPIPNSGGKSWKVITVPSYLSQGANQAFTSKIVVVDKEGNETTPRVPFDEFIELDAADVVTMQASRFLTNKD